jgi:hypothetical protein
MVDWAGVFAGSRLQVIRNRFSRMPFSPFFASKTFAGQRCNPLVRSERDGAFPAGSLYIAIKRALAVVVEVRRTAHRFYPDGPQKLDTAWLSPVMNKRGRE